MNEIMPRPPQCGCIKSLCLSVRPSVCLSVENERSWQAENCRKEARDPFRGRKVKGQGSKVTSQNIFSFETSVTAGSAGGVT